MDRETITTGDEAELGRFHGDLIDKIPENPNMPIDPASELVAPTHVEHPDLDPDGVPHDVIARLAFDAWVIAATCLLALFWSSWFVMIGAAVLIVSVLARLDRRAKRERQESYRNVPDLLE
jgi:hypothetical protein